MKKTILTMIFFSILRAMIFADVKSVGVGGMIGDPAGLSAKFWLAETGAVDTGLNVRTSGGSSIISLNADYLIHDLKMEDAEAGKMFLYYGLGVRILNTSGIIGTGVRIPIGLTYLFQKAPLDIFLETVPTIDVTTSSGFSFAGSLGFRFYLERKEPAK